MAATRDLSNAGHRPAGFPNGGVYFRAAMSKKGGR